ncbi:JmjC domain-containing protein 5 [Vanrija pseudolonga]|uniref:JmjC domain-containing protein 5 n=1 Tax=Vanrija pseudolonga TaxID=143232 RepID=A0AAF0Y5N0_9TREE|nr:JmjC domain-containing protein 5 [Vanrija pseudolonga]
MIAPARTIPNLSAAALRTYLSAPAPRPLVLPGLVGHWSASAEWQRPDFGALRRQVGEHTAVEVELAPRGRGYLDDRWARHTMGFGAYAQLSQLTPGLFLDAFVLHKIPSADPAALPVGYLAQADLLDSPSAPQLAAAAPPLEHYATGPRGDVYRRNLWVGPAGSFTPFHRDPNIGLYTQVAGAKVFHLLPPGAHAGPSAPVFETSKKRGNTSRLPVAVGALLGGEGEGDGAGLEGMDEAERTRWRSALAAAFELDGACEARLSPGDSVLIPEGWWHSAVGLDAGVGVNAWFR